MRLCSNPDYYQNVPVLFWPWVFWQLLQVDLWVEETGRSVYGAVCRKTGRVYVDFWADDPNAEKPWKAEDLDELLPGVLTTALSTIHLSPAGAIRDQLGMSALSLVHVSGEAAIRNPLHLACAQRSARDQTQPSQSASLPLPEI